MSDASCRQPQRVTEFVELLERISGTRRKFSEAVFTTDLKRLIQDLEPGDGEQFLALSHGALTLRIEAL